MYNSYCVTSWLWAKTGEGQRGLYFLLKCFVLLNSEAANTLLNEFNIECSYNASSGC